MIHATTTTKRRQPARQLQLLLLLLLQVQVQVHVLSRQHRITNNVNTISQFPIVLTQSVLHTSAVIHRRESARRFVLFKTVLKPATHRTIPWPLTLEWLDPNDVQQTVEGLREYLDLMCRARCEFVNTEGSDWYFKMRYYKYFSVQTTRKFCETNNWCVSSLVLV